MTHGELNQAVGRRARRFFSARQADFTQTHYSAFARDPEACRGTEQPCDTHAC